MRTSQRAAAELANLGTEDRASQKLHSRFVIAESARKPMHRIARFSGPSSLRDVLAAHDLLRNLTMRDIRSKYRRTALGQGWSLLNPVIQITIYSVVFGYVLRIKPTPATSSGLDVFVLWLGAALLPFLFFATVINTGALSLIANANLIQKVYFPRESLVLANLFSCVFSFLIEIVVLHVAVLLFGGTIRIELVALTMLLIIMLAAFAFGLALLSSVATVYFRDTQYLLTLLMQAWFYATPIFYPIALIQRRLGADSTGYLLYRLNPMQRFTAAFRDTIYNGTVPDLATIGICAGYTVGAVLVGHAVFRRLEGRLAEEL